MQEAGKQHCPPDGKCDNFLITQDFLAGSTFPSQLRHKDTSPKSICRPSPMGQNKTEKKVEPLKEKHIKII